MLRDQYSNISYLPRYLYLIIAYEIDNLIGRCSIDLLPGSIQYDYGASALGVIAKGKVILMKLHQIGFIHASTILLSIWQLKPAANPTYLLE